MQLIQYTPSTFEVCRRPLLITPPWINKYYILDLQARNSFIKWAVDQGLTVFVLSWVNPDETLRDKDNEPAPFDLLYWNSDSTRMPARMHSTYLRKMYMENALREPGGIEVDGVPIDLRAIETPAYFVSAAEDHIAPWKTTSPGAQLLSGPVTFVLSKAGHVAGIVNPPSGKQYGYYSGGDIKGLTAAEWFAQAPPREQSWWPNWLGWLATHAGEKVRARVPGEGKLPVLETAPSSSARARLGS